MRQIHILHANFDTETGKFMCLETETNSEMSLTARSQVSEESSVDDGIYDDRQVEEEEPSGNPLTTQII